MLKSTGVGVLVLMLAAAPAAFAQQPAAHTDTMMPGISAAAGRIKVASGSAFVVRAGRAMPAKIGEEVFEADTLRTGSNGRIGVTLKDDTRVSLGPTSEIRLNQFAFAPAEGQFAVVLRLVRGVAAYVSGRIAKLAPDSIRLETPAAIVGVRGTTLILRSE